MRVIPEMCRALWLSKLFIFERTRCGLFQKCAVRCGCPNYLFLSVPDEGYSRNVPCAVAVQTIYFWAYQMRVVPEMCRALWLSKLFIFERTRWGLFQKCAVRCGCPNYLFLSVPDEGYSRNVPCTVAVQTIYFWAYQMRVIPEMCHAH
jgi:hypothetical protein